MAYAVRTDIEAIYGSANVEKWADLNNDGVVLSIATRIAAALAYAEVSVVDDRLRGSRYTIPFSAPIPSTITHLTALAAGVWLYESRGVVDFDPTSGKPQHKLHWQAKQVETLIEELRSGVIRLDINATSSTPLTIPKVVTT